MSDYLDRVSRNFERRIAVHDAMLKHLGLEPCPDQAPFLFDELRATLLACASCSGPNRCARWQSGPALTPLPPFCAGRHAFDALADACDALTEVRAMA